MTHPDELELADYVDDALPDAERALVERHLTACGTCREDVLLARAGRALATSLPALEAPDEIGRPAIEERAGPSVSPSAHRRWDRPLAALAAAAVIVAVAVIGPKLLSSSNDAGITSAAAPSATTGIAPTFDNGAEGAAAERQNVNYDRAALASLATGEFSGNVPQSPPSEGGAVAVAVRPCFVADPPPDARVLRIIRARYEGTPAVIVVFAQGAGPDHVVVRALAGDSCRVLATAAAP